MRRQLYDGIPRVSVPTSRLMMAISRFFAAFKGQRTHASRQLTAFQ